LMSVNREKKVSLRTSCHRHMDSWWRRANSQKSLLDRGS